MSATAVQRATSVSKRKRAARRPETLDEAKIRLVELKWSDSERHILDDVIDAMRNGELSYDAEKKLSKKAVLEAYDTLREMRRQRKLDELVRTKPGNFQIITNEAEFERFIGDLYREPITAWDTETTGLDLFRDTMVGFSVWLPQADYGVYVPFAHGAEMVDTDQQRYTKALFDGQLDAEYVLDRIRGYLENSEYKTVWHNARYDYHMLRNHGINPSDPFFDTQVAAHVLNENESHRLKDLATKYLGVAADHFASLFGDDPTIWDKPYAPAGIYAIKDVLFTWKLYEFQRPHIDKRDGLNFIFWSVEMPQIRASLEMERNGFGLDFDGCKALEAEFEPMVAEALEAVHSAFGTKTPEFLQAMSETLGRQIDEFNIGSPQQLQFLIYDYLALPDISKSVNPKLAARSTAHDVLEKLGELDDRLEPLLTYREYEKLLNTYIRKFPKVVGPDNRIHYQLSQFGTETGRYSSKQYGDKKNKLGVNIQNIPARTKASKRVRRLLIAVWDG